MKRNPFQDKTPFYKIKIQVKKGNLNEIMRLEALQNVPPSFLCRLIVP